MNDTECTRNGVVSRLAYYMGGHNASEKSPGRLQLSVDVSDDDALANYFYDTISEDAIKGYKDEVRIEAAPDNLDLHESLMVRGCKISKPSVGRFKRILGRFCGLDIGYVEKKYVGHFLLDIIEKYNLCSMLDIVDGLNDDELWQRGSVKGCELPSRPRWITGEEPIVVPHEDRVIILCVSIIKLTYIRKLPGLRSPSKFNKKKMNIKPLICVNCKHHQKVHDSDMCHLPIGKSTSLVDGEVTIKYLRKYCSSERQKVYKASRWLGAVECGEEAIHYEPK
tara:strand:- start:351 stop:1190 length:840 start_codon:yes stop_codon:yes gene_type:complete